MRHIDSIRAVLNQDSKIYAAILPKIMEEMMSLLIDEDQSGFIQCRQTQDNIRMIHTTEYIQKEKHGAILLGMHAEKSI